MAPYTGRGLAELLSKSIFPLGLHEGSQVLEVGCGKGRAVLQLAGLGITCTCLNAPGYTATQYYHHNGSWVEHRFAQQADDAASLENTVSRYRVRFNQSKHAMPQMVLASYKAGMPFPNGSFSVVLSQHSMNEGKMHHPEEELSTLLDEIERLLKPRGVAVLHLFDEDVPGVVNSTALLAYRKYHDTTAWLYTLHLGRANPSVVVMMRRHSVPQDQLLWKDSMWPSWRRPYARAYSRALLAWLTSGRWLATLHPPAAFRRRPTLRPELSTPCDLREDARNHRPPFCTYFERAGGCNQGRLGEQICGHVDRACRVMSSFIKLNGSKLRCKEADAELINWHFTDSKQLPM